MRSAVPLVLLAAVAAFVVWSTHREQTMDVDGYLYRGWARMPSEHPVGPVADAIISDARSTSRARTDASGHFHLQTSHPARDEFVVLQVKSGELVRCLRVHGYPHLKMDLILSSLAPCDAAPAAPAAAPRSQ